MNELLLNEIANIRSGFTFRGKINEEKGSNILMLQIKDVRDSTRIDTNGLLEIEWEAKSKLPAMRIGEIAIVARGSTNQAALMVHDNKTVIPSNQIMIISVKSKLISPEYLCWYLNRSSTQLILSQQQAGTSIPSLSKSALSVLSVPVPKLEIQSKIVRLSELHQQERYMYEKLITNRAKMLDGVFQQLLKNGEEK